jgi:NAD(P)H-dependent FMN reductase
MLWYEPLEGMLAARSLRMSGDCEILVMCGSFRSDSVTRRALEIVAEGIHRAGGRVVWADPWMNVLPLYGSRDVPGQEEEGLLAAGARAHGFLWGSPEYHGTCSGLLKNALDHLSYEQTEGKWAAFVATAGGSQGAQCTLMTLRTVARNLHLWTLPEEVSVASSHKALGPDGRFLDSKVEGRLLRLGADLVAAIRRFSSGAAAPGV